MHTKDCGSLSQSLRIYGSRTTPSMRYQYKREPLTTDEATRLVTANLQDPHFVNCAETFTICPLEGLVGT